MDTKKIVNFIILFKNTYCSKCVYSFADKGEIKCNWINHHHNRDMFHIAAYGSSNLKKINLHQISKCKLLNYFSNHIT